MNDIKFKKPRADSYDSRAIDVYKRTLSRTFTFLKQTAKYDELLAKSIPLKDDQGYLIPVCELHVNDKRIIELFAKWRSENTFAFPTQFPVTLEGTSSWLRTRLLDVEDRFLFLVIDRYGIPIGHLGYASGLNDDCALEVDNVVRGVKDSEPGIMSNAMFTLINWAREVIGPREIFLRVFASNEHAINFYHKIGFIDDGKTPLRKTKKDETISYVPVAEGDKAPPDEHFLSMVYKEEPKLESTEMILTAGPSISAREASYALDAARYGWNNKWSYYIKRFEEEFANYLGVKHALSTSSGTGALHLSLMALGIGPGDEVIVPDITWVATANAVVYVGAIPVFADVQPDTWCLDPKSFEDCITERTKAVIPVHLYGHPAEMDRIMAIASKHNLYVIEDAAPAIGAEFTGTKVGTFGDIAAYSFQGAKLVVTGEGGMIVTNNSDLHSKIYSLWDQGRDPGTFWINKVGVKYKMSNIQAAIGLGQIERVEELIESKRRIFSWYAEGLAGIPHIKLNSEAPWARSIYWMSSIELSLDAPISTEDLRAALKANNVDTRPVFPAISQYPIWPVSQKPKPNAQRIGNQAINLPSGVCLTRSQVQYICDKLKDILTQA